MRLDHELRIWGIHDWLVSSNLQTKLDGMPYANQSEPSDVGVAVYFRLRAGGKPKVFACDRWNRVADNIAAIAGHVEALRRVERYGVGEVEKVLAGYTALPPSAEDWRSVFGFGPDETPTFAEVDRRYKRQIQAAHPDKEFGDSLQAARLNTARDMARWELKEQEPALSR